MPTSMTIANRINIRTTHRFALAATAALGIVGLMSAAAPAANAQTLYLVGAYYFGSSSTGATTNTGYQYDTDNAESTVADTLGLTLNGTSYNNKNIAIALASGANNFTFTGISSVNPGSYDTLGLFFSTTATPYDPSSAASARTPDLVFSSATNSSTAGDFVPVSGTSINSYYFDGATTTANGLSSMMFGGTKVAVSNLSSNTSPNGAFTLTTSAAAPEPTPLMLLVPGVMGMVVARRRRTQSVA